MFLTAVMGSLPFWSRQAASSREVYQPSGEGGLVLVMPVDVDAHEPAGGDDLVAAGHGVVRGVPDELVGDPPSAQLGRDVGVEEVELPLAGRAVLAHRLAAVDHGIVLAFAFIMLYVDVHRLLLALPPGSSGVP